MKFLRNHWYDIGGILGVMTLVLVSLFKTRLSDYQTLMWLSLASLFFHQLEEYRIAATFPGMINSVVFKSELPDRYPLNSNTSLIINVVIGWVIYILAAIAAERLVWLGLAAILVSLGNFIAHTLLFNIKGRTLYNAGLLTSWLFFAPCVFFFFRIVAHEQLATVSDYLIGAALGVVINVVGVFKLIGWLADRNTKFVFKRTQLLRRDRPLSRTEA